MLEAKVMLSNALGPDFFRRLAADIDEKVGTKMEYWGNRKLSQHEATEKREPTSISVDGLPADRADFRHARKTIQILFLQRLVSIAIGEIRTAMRMAIQERGASGLRGYWTNKPEVQTSVRVFYGGNGKPISDVNWTEISDFKPGDVLLVVPTFGLQVYSNATMYRGPGPGIMALAVRKIRSILKLRNKSSALQVTANRSRAAFYKMMGEGSPFRPDGSTVQMTTPWPGSDSLWVIAIRFRKNYRGSLDG